ncbi:HEAT repeats [uncultured archaeon]|nr:HEAT repeats [uncultured archaeon]
MSERKGSRGAAAASASGQAHLPPAPTSAQDESARIDKLVSLTYDSNPEVRRSAARELAKIDDPRAVFALLELGADKDPGVQDMARSSLDHFKGEEKETLVSLEKIFEARQEGKPLPADMAETRQKLMPSLERLFSKNKAAREKLMPSIEKLFSWMPASSAGGHPDSASPLPSSPSSAAPVQPGASRSSFEQVATAHMTDEEKEEAVASREASLSRSPSGTGPSSPRAASEHGAPGSPAGSDKSFPHPGSPYESASGSSDDDSDEDDSDALPASVPISEQHSDPFAGVPAIRHQPRSALEQAEADVGVPAHLRSSDELRRLRLGHAGHGASGSPSGASRSMSSSAMQARMEEATNFPVPEYLQPKAPSPTASLPSMMEEVQPEPLVEEEGVKMPRHALYYYKLAYAIAMTPGIKASEVKKEKDRLVKEAKADIELAFDLAVKRTHAEGIESLSGLKPGMKKLSTLPLEVLDNVVVSVPHGKKLLAYNRILLSDGKHQLPLYVQPPRADGIRSGDLLSLRDAMVDYWVKSNPAPGSTPGELVLLLGKNGQLMVTK